MEGFSLTPLRDALETLDEALAIRPRTRIVRDGTIQRFEYTYELAWKSLKKILESEFGASELPVKDMWREAARQGLIRGPEPWFEFHRARNLTSHVYSQKVAGEVFAIAKRFPPKARRLIKALEKFEDGAGDQRKDRDRPRRS